MKTKISFILIIALHFGFAVAKSKEAAPSKPDDLTSAFDACRTNNLKEMKKLKDKGFEVSKQKPLDLGGEVNSLLLTAISWEATEVAEWLIENGAILVLRDKYCYDLNLAADRSPKALLTILSDRIRLDNHISKPTKVLMFSEALAMAKKSKRDGRDDAVKIMLESLATLKSKR